MCIATFDGIPLFNLQDLILFEWGKSFVENLKSLNIHSQNNNKRLGHIKQPKLTREKLNIPQRLSMRDWIDDLRWAGYRSAWMLA